MRKLDLATNAFVGGLTATGDMGGVEYLYSQNSQIALSPDGQLLAVPGAFNDRFDLVRTSDMTIAQTFAPLGTFITRVSWSPEGDEILISDRDADTVILLRRPTALSPFALVGNIPVVDQPFDTLVLPNSDRAFVLHFGTSPSLGVLDLSTLSLTSALPLPFTPAGMALSENGTRLNVLSVRETTTTGAGSFTRVVDGEITVFDTSTLAVVEQIDTNQTGAQLSADASGRVLAVPGMSSDVLVVVGSPCGADFNGDGTTNAVDVAEYLNAWFADQVNGTLNADFDGNGVSNAVDVSEYFNTWFVDQAGGCAG